MLGPSLASDFNGKKCAFQWPHNTLVNVHLCSLNDRLHLHLNIPNVDELVNSLRTIGL